MLILGFDLKRASATSLVVVVITAAAGSIGYAIHEGVVWSAAVTLGAGATVGSYLGARLLASIPSRFVMGGFALLLVALAIRLLLNPVGQGADDFQAAWPVLAGMFALGFGAGLLSGLLGVGGGIMVVPLLVVLFGLTSVEAKGTSLVMMIPAGLIGTWVNFKNNFVNVRAGLIIGVVSASFSYAGVAVAVVMPSMLSNILFAVLMLYTAVHFFYRAVKSLER